MAQNFEYEFLERLGGFPTRVHVVQIFWGQNGNMLDRKEKMFDQIPTNG